MKTKLKTAGLVIAAVVLVAVSILGTMAYLTDKAEVSNTFTVGKVDIKLDETKIGGEAGERTEVGNQYHLMPGGEYVKDPQITVKQGSEESYIRILMTINAQQRLDTLFPNAGFGPFIKDLNTTQWEYIGHTHDTTADTRTYEYRYKTTIAAPDNDMPLAALFQGIKVPETVTGADLQTLMQEPALKIDIVAQAIQAEGFVDADAAWAAFPTP